MTTVFSIFAYIWLYLCLKVFSVDEITLFEAIMTFSFFFILLIIAYCADRLNKKLQKKKVCDVNKMEIALEELRGIVHEKGYPYLISALV